MQSLILMYVTCMCLFKIGISTMVEISWNMMNHLGEEQWLITIVDILPAENGDSFITKIFVVENRPDGYLAKSVHPENGWNTKYVGLKLANTAIVFFFNL